MAKGNTQNGMGNLLGFAVIALIIGSVVYSAWEPSEPVQEKPVEQPKVVQVQPQTPTHTQLMEKFGIGDGKLGAAQTLSASDLGKATPISGGGFSVSSSGSSSSSGRRSASTQPSTPPRQSGG